MLFFFNILSPLFVKIKKFNLKFCLFIISYNFAKSDARTQLINKYCIAIKPHFNVLHFVKLDFQLSGTVGPCYYPFPIEQRIYRYGERSSGSHSK